MHGQPKKEAASLVPWSHPLMRRNGLVNQIDFLGLVHFCNSVNYSVKKNMPNLLKKDTEIFTGVRSVLYLYM